ncbi:MAG: hypothetical protein NTV88_05740 [Candidatus Micrarchaeota archaeon]|nr:hypothetical protein [Candidatus Micrarchaeota archaeon]
MTRGGMAGGRHMRGFVFTIDATLALFLLVLSVVVVSFLSLQAEDAPYVRLGIARVGKDTLNVLDRQGIIEAGSTPQIEAALNGTLPSNVGAHLQVSTYYYESGSFSLLGMKDYGPLPSNNSSTYGARLDFVGMKNSVVANYSIVRMTIWQK